MVFSFSNGCENVIRNIGFNTDGQSGIYACGDGSIEPSLKQEKECLVN